MIASDRRLHRCLSTMDLNPQAFPQITRLFVRSTTYIKTDGNWTDPG